MFKKFYIYLIFSSIFISIFFSFSNNNVNYYYPIKNSNFISSYYGIRELYGKYNFHNGIDIPATINTPVHSIGNGVIKYVGFNTSGYGNYIVILHSNSYKSLYGHLSENYIVKIGDNIGYGQVIGYVGPKILSNGLSNGNTTGPHLHFTVFTNNGDTIDPLSLTYKK